MSIQQLSQILKINVNASILLVSIIKIPDFHNASKESFSIKIENLLKNGRIRNKPNNKDLFFFFLNEVTTDIPIHCNSHSVSHVEISSSEYSLQTPNNSFVAFIILETQEIRDNIFN